MILLHATDEINVIRPFNKHTKQPHFNAPDMNKTVDLLFVCSLLSFAATAQNREWLDPNVNELNRAPMHTYYFAYESESRALTGIKENSANVVTLNGYWMCDWV